MNEVWVASFLLSNREKIGEPILLVHPQDLRNITLTARDRSLQFSGLEIIEVKVAPVITLREPDHLTGAWKNSPIRAVLPALEKGRHFFLDDVPDVPIPDVTHTKSRAFVVTRR